jgi:hypothetical protein
MSEDTVVNVVLFLFLCGLVILGRWTYRNPESFMDRFNPYMKPYGRMTLAIAKFAGGLWFAGATVGCISMIVQVAVAAIHRLF